MNKYLYLLHYIICNYGFSVYVVSFQPGKFNDNSTTPTYLLRLGNTTSNGWIGYMQFKVVFKEEKCCPILYFWHEGQESNYRRDSYCFEDSIFERNHLVDKQIFWLNRDSSLCTRHNDLFQCSGSVSDLLTGFAARWFLDVGYPCSNLQSIALSYDVTLRVSDNVTCANFDIENNEIHATCAQFYSSYTEQNYLGKYGSEIDSFYRTAGRAYIGSGCYQNALEVGCMGFYPRCVNNTLYPMCRNMCVEFIESCEMYLTDGWALNCTALPHDGHCHYKPVLCEIPNIEHGTASTLSKNDANVAAGGSTINFTCEKGFQSQGGSKSAVCFLTGHLNSKVPKCEEISSSKLTLAAVVAPFICVFVSLAIIILVYVYWYREKRRKKLEKQKNSHQNSLDNVAIQPNNSVTEINIPHSSLANSLDTQKNQVECSNQNTGTQTRLSLYGKEDSWRKNYSTTIKLYDIFLAYCSKDYKIAVHKILPKLENGSSIGYKVHLHDRDFLAGEFIAVNIVKAIRHSRSAVLCVSQNFIDSEWCQYEFMKSYHNTVEDRDFSLILIMLEPFEKLKNVPDLLTEHYHTHTCILGVDDTLTSKLRDILGTSLNQLEMVRCI